MAIATSDSASVISAPRPVRRRLSTAASTALASVRPASASQAGNTWLTGPWSGAPVISGKPTAQFTV